MSLTVVLVADTRASAVEASVHALVSAVDQAEAALGATVEVLVVDSSGRADVATFLRSLGGARVLHAEGLDRAGALALALAGNTAEVVWFGGTESCAAPTALAAMAEVALRDGGLVVASADDPAPHVAAPGDVLRRLWAPTGEQADPVPELVRRARTEGIAVSTAPGAGVLRERIRRPQANSTTLVGPGTYAGQGLVLQTYTPADRVELGAYCSIADQVSIVLPGGRLYDEDGTELQLTLRGHHREETASTFPVSILVPDEPYDEPPPGAVGERLVLGDDVWVGYGARIVGEVTVGTGSIVGAGALVIADVPPYSVVGGVPARVLRKRFEDDVVERLLRVRWWDWQEVAVQGAHLWFLRPVAEFLDHFDPGAVDGAGETPPT